jgi:hypothetical protein
MGTCASVVRELRTRSPTDATGAAEAVLRVEHARPAHRGLQPPSFRRPLRAIPRDPTWHRALSSLDVDHWAVTTHGHVCGTRVSSIPRRDRCATRRSAGACRRREDVSCCVARVSWAQWSRAHPSVSEGPCRSKGDGVAHPEPGCSALRVLGPCREEAHRQGRQRLYAAKRRSEPRRRID